ncbi:IS256 family transposase [Tistrella bauzanensis]|uniref:IS256 family transposase n=1 Tax=Tistrella bauzanensis TaxID=657419 RepID=UPI003556ACB6
MKRSTTSPAVGPSVLVEEAVDEVRASFERLRLTAGLAALSGMMEEDAARLCGPRHGRGGDRGGHRWGRTKGKIGFHGGKVEIERPRVRARGGDEMTLPSWAAAVDEDLLGQWALNLMLMNVSTRKFGRAVRLPGGDIPAERGAGVTKSAVSRRFVALSAEKMQAWMAADLSGLDLLVIQIDGIHIDQDLILLAAVGIDGNGDKHPLGVMEGASENAAVCQALIDNLVGRGLDPAVCRLFIIDGSRALLKAIRASFGRNAPIQRCQVHKARNITERLPKSLHASVRRTLRQAWELDDADKAEKLIRNLARRLEREAPGVSASILEGLDEILTVTRLRLPIQLRRSLACTNIIENMNGSIRRICRNVKRWRDAAMALRWTGAAMIEAAKGFRRLKAHKQLPNLRAALLAHQAAFAISVELDPVCEAA